MSALQNRVCQHLRCIGVSVSESRRFSALVEKWATQSGLEWTVDRFKSLAVYLTQRLQGEIPQVPVGWAVRTNRHGQKIFKDPLVHRLLSRTVDSQENLRVMRSFTQLYKIIVLDKVSERQLAKFFKSVESGYTGEPALLKRTGDVLASLVPTTMAGIDWSGIWSRPVDNISTMASPGRRGPVVNNTGQMRSHSHDDYRSCDLSSLRLCEDLHELWRRHPVETVMSLFGECAHSENRVPRMWGTLMSRGIDTLPVGNIAFLQEGGAKLRSIANPTLVYQSLGEPLKRILEHATRQIKQIYTFDQDAGRETIAQWLSHGDKVWCFDLTSFTDRYPFSLQLRILEEMSKCSPVSQFDVDLMKMVASKEWRYIGPNKKERMVRWKVGQPLGFGPSFHLATLTHFMLTSALQASLNKKGDLFAIVGDDIVIRDKDLAQRYQSHTERLGVEISTSKSLISEISAEFCGKIITKDGIIPSMKLRFLQKPSQLTKALEFYGPKALPFLRKKERRWAYDAFLPKPIGLGWRAGLTMAEYLEYFDTVGLRDETLARELSQFLGRPLCLVALSQSIKRSEYGRETIDPLGSYVVTHGGPSWETVRSIHKAHGSSRSASTDTCSTATVNYQMIIDSATRQGFALARTREERLKVLEDNIQQYFDKFGYPIWGKRSTIGMPTLVKDKDRNDRPTHTEPRWRRIVKPGLFDKADQWYAEEEDNGKASAAISPEVDSNGPGF